MNRIHIAWISWRLDTAEQELTEMQARGDVGPIYLCGLLTHINELSWRLEALKGTSC